MTAIAKTLTNRYRYTSNDPWDIFNTSAEVHSPYPMTLPIDPFVALIDGLGITEDNTLDPSNYHRFDGDLFMSDKKGARTSVQDFISLIEVNPTTVDLVADIKEYYRTAMGMLKLQGIELTPWREHMLQVLNDCDRKIITEGEDLKVLFKLYEFYYEDMQIDMLTHDTEPAVRLCGGDKSKPYGMAEARTFHNVIPIKTAVGCNRAAKTSSTYYLYCRTQDNSVVRVNLRGSAGTRDLVDLVVKHQIPINVSGITQISLANGSQVCYYSVQKAEITEGTK